MPMRHHLRVCYHKPDAFLVLFLLAPTRYVHLPCTCLIWSRLSLGHGPIVRSRSTTRFFPIRQQSTILALNLFDRHLTLPSADVSSERRHARLESSRAGRRCAAGTPVTTSATLLRIQGSVTNGQSLLVY
jgi:hypothetical protein